MDNNNIVVPLPFCTYEEMQKKVSRYNALRSLIKTEIDKGNNFEMKDDLVIALLGLKEYKAQKERKTAND